VKHLEKVRAQVWLPPCFVPRVQTSRYELSAQSISLLDFECMDSEES